ncbi:MAG: hypothetical protein ACT6T0_15895, partial [Nevskia sp.]|uniref:hypothetical protein n=1 Tax=Nevskia sp. TaxID=1929292 RepID=UPI0040371A31
MEVEPQRRRLETRYRHGGQRQRQAIADPAGSARQRLPARLGGAALAGAGRGAHQVPISLANTDTPPVRNTAY